MHYNPAAREKSGRGSARLERTVRVREVPGSNPGAPTKTSPISFISNSATTLLDNMKGRFFIELILVDRKASQL